MLLLWTGEESGKAKHVTCLNSSENVDHSLCTENCVLLSEGIHKKKL